VSNPIAGHDDVANILKPRVLTGDEQDRADVLCDAVLATLELHLNRWLWERSVLREKHRTGPQGRVTLWRGPVAWIDALHYGLPTAASVAFPVDQDWEEPGTFPSRTTLWVDYTAGDDFPDVPWAAAATEVVATAAARVIAAPIQVATGVIQSYSVEGTTITYGKAFAGGADSKGRLSVGDLGVLARLRVLVVL
jgi:hypothetical protein